VTQVSAVDPPVAAALAVLSEACAAKMQVEMQVFEAAFRIRLAAELQGLQAAVETVAEVPAWDWGPKTIAEFLKLERAAIGHAVSFALAGPAAVVYAHGSPPMSVGAVS
jgi:hypothetical protein